MTSGFASLILAVSAVSTGGLFDRTVAVVPVASGEAAHAGHAHPGHVHGHGHGLLAPGGRIMPPGPGAGWGFPNGNPDGYGWVDYGTFLPLGANRTPDYFFPRQFALLPVQVFYPQYYNPYVMRGQRYVPFTGCGGAHPNGGPPTALAVTPVYPDRETTGGTPRTAPPSFTGEVEAPPVPRVGSGLNR